MSAILFRGQPLRLVSAECFAPLPDSGHEQCPGVTGSGEACRCFCHDHPSGKARLRVIR